MCSLRSARTAATTVRTAAGTAGAAGAAGSAASCARAAGTARTARTPRTKKKANEQIVDLNAAKKEKSDIFQYSSQLEMSVIVELFLGPTYDAKTDCRRERTIAAHEWLCCFSITVLLTVCQKSTFLLPRLNTTEPKRAKMQKSRTQSVKS